MQEMATISLMFSPAMAGYSPLDYGQSRAPCRLVSEAWFQAWSNGHRPEADRCAWASACGKICEHQSRQRDLTGPDAGSGDRPLRFLLDCRVDAGVHAREEEIGHVADGCEPSEAGLTRQIQMADRASGNPSVYDFKLARLHRTGRRDGDPKRGDPVFANDGRRPVEPHVVDEVLKLRDVGLLETLVESRNRIVGDDTLGHHQDRSFTVVADLNCALRADDFRMDAIAVNAAAAEGDHAEVAIHEVERRDAVVVVADLAHLRIGQRAARAEHALHFAHVPPGHVEIVDAHVNEEAAAARRPEKLNRRRGLVL